MKVYNLDRIELTDGLAAIIAKDIFLDASGGCHTYSYNWTLFDLMSGINCNNPQHVEFVEKVSNLYLEICRKDLMSGLDEIV